MTVDESQLVAVGLGVKAPKFPNILTEEEWNKNAKFNRRVVIRVRSVETELDKFQK
jgi:hypothetical protein